MSWLLGVQWIFRFMTTPNTLVVKKTYRQEPQDVFIVEGISLLEDKRLRDLMDIKLL